MINNEYINTIIPQKYWSIETAKTIFHSAGLVLDDEKYINEKTKMKCHDCDNYYYMQSINDIIQHKKLRKLYVLNPFSLDNLKMYFINNNSKTIPLFDEYKNYKSKELFQCECGIKFYAMISEIIHGKIFCNTCMRKKRYDSFRDYYGIILKECEARDYKLLSTEISRSNDKIQYICNKHKDKGVQSTDYDNMINLNHGCKYCGFERRGIKHRIPEKTLQSLAEEKGFLYVGCDYNTPLKSGNIKVNLHLICKNHVEKGVQYIRYDSLKINTTGCIYCNGYGRTQKSLQAEFDNIGCNIEIIQFNSYSDLYVKCKDCGYAYNTSGINILSEHFCPICSKSRSNGELYISNILNAWEIEFEVEKTFPDCKDKSVLPFDFFIRKNNLIIEFDGIQHFIPISFSNIDNKKAKDDFLKIVKHDFIKNEYCRKNRIPILRLSYIDKEDQLLDYKIFDFLKKHNAIV